MTKGKLILDDAFRLLGYFIKANVKVLCCEKNIYIQEQKGDWIFQNVMHRGAHEYLKNISPT